MRAAFSALETDQPRHTGLEARIATTIIPTLEGLGYELVRVSVLGRDVPTVQIMADRADGALIAVEDCETISHAVSAVLDVDDVITGFNLAPVRDRRGRDMQFLALAPRLVATKDFGVGHHRQLRIRPEKTAGKETE